MTKLLLLTLALSIPVSACAQNSKTGVTPCITLDSLVTIKGHLRSVAFPDPNSVGNKTVNEWVLRLEKPICVVGEDSARNAIDIQLEHSLWFNVPLRRKINKLMRAHKLVTITGPLHYQAVGYDFLPIQLDVVKIK